MTSIWWSLKWKRSRWSPIAASASAAAWSPGDPCLPPRWARLAARFPLPQASRRPARAPGANRRRIWRISTGWPVTNSSSTQRLWASAPRTRWRRWSTAVTSSRASTAMLEGSNSQAQPALEAPWPARRWDPPPRWSPRSSRPPQPRTARRTTTTTITTTRRLTIRRPACSPAATPSATSTCTWTIASRTSSWWPWPCASSTGTCGGSAKRRWSGSNRRGGPSKTEAMPSRAATSGSSRGTSWRARRPSCCSRWTTSSRRSPDWCARETRTKRSTRSSSAAASEKTARAATTTRRPRSFSCEFTGT